jgi:hypothetical protein
MGKRKKKKRGVELGLEDVRRGRVDCGFSTVRGIQKGDAKSTEKVEQEES